MTFYNLIFWICAIICNAVMDTLQHHHSTSIFRNHVKGFWSDAINESWKNKYIDGDVNNGRVQWFGGLINKPIFFTDAFHFFKALMILFLSLTIISFDNTLIATNFSPLFALAYIVLWHYVFESFYGYVLLKKK